MLQKRLLNKLEKLLSPLVNLFDRMTMKRRKNLRRKNRKKIWMHKILREA